MINWRDMRNAQIFEKLRLKPGAKIVIENNDGTETEIDLTELSGLDDTAISKLATEAGTGITTGTGTVYQSSVSKVGGIIHTKILIDLTGLNSSAAADIIGVDSAANCHIGQITAARNGTVLTGRVTCLEAPAGGEPDIDLYAADEATGTEDAAITALTETALLLAAADWTLGDQKILTAMPSANDYLYLVGSGGGTDDTYTAGKFLIELEGYEA